MKKIISLLVATASVFAFASCSGKDVNTDEGGSGASVPPPIVEDDVIDTTQQTKIDAVSIWDTAGTVQGGGVYDIGDSVTLTATANAGYAFTMWDDGVTDAQRVVEARNITSYTALFEAVDETDASLFTYEATPFGASITAYLGTDPIIRIPQKIQGLAVIELGKECFNENTTLRCVTLSDGITDINDGAFWHCTNLCYVSIPQTVTTIGSKAFWQCSSLSSVILPEGVTSLGDYAFNCCHSLKDVTIPSTLTTLGRYVFFYCENLEYIDVALGNTAFTTFEGVLFSKDMSTIVTYPNAHGGDQYALPTHTTTVGNGAFATCSSLKAVTLHGAVTSLGNYAFYNCTAMENAVIPSSVTSMGDSAFADCTALASITVPSSVSSVGEGVLTGTTALTAIKTPEASTFAQWCIVNGLSDKIVNN